MKARSGRASYSSPLAASSPSARCARSRLGNATASPPAVEQMPEAMDYERATNDGKGNGAGVVSSPVRYCARVAGMDLIAGEIVVSDFNMSRPGFSDSSAGVNMLSVGGTHYLGDSVNTLRGRQ